MKKKFAFLFLLPFLVSCGGESTTTPVSTPTEETSASATSTEQTTSDPNEDSSVISVPDSSLSSESESIVSSEEESTKTNVTFVYDMFPMPKGSSYPTSDEEKTITADETTIYTDYVMQGEGDYANTVQMKKGVSSIYNTTPVYGTFRITIKQNLVSYGGETYDYTGVPTLYLGAEQHPTDTASVSEYTKVENDGYLDYTFTTEVNGYFTLANESSYAVRFTQFSIR